ncbi:MAG TPA: hypothetical protein VHC18_07730 [Amycolatopsis sp.]|nr:hypothetical protein [Amycolatopsis sp.]
MDDDGIEDHPDLLDPDWQRHAEKEAWIDLRKARRRTKRGKRIVVPLTVLVVLAGAGYGVYRWGKTTSDQYTGDKPAVAAPTTTAPSDLPMWGHVDLTHPFNDTPAQAWAEGIAGLTTPPPGKVGAFGAQQTAAAIEQVKQAISAAALDPVTLVDHRPDRYLSLFAPDDRDQMRADLTSPDATRAARWVDLVAGGYHLLPVAPRMNGNITLKPGAAGELVVHVTYVAAYAFDPGDTPVSGPADLVAFQREDDDYVLRTSPPFSKSSAGLWRDSSSGYDYSVACDAANKGYLAPLFSNRYGGTDTTTAIEPGMFDPDQPPPTGPGNC